MALARLTQYGEDKYVIMFGGLHIKMTAFKSIGTLLKDSGWTSALVEVGVASPGTAESFLSASSVTRTWYAHQITVCGLYEFMKDAYNVYREEKRHLTTLTPHLKCSAWSRRVHSSSSGFSFIGWS